MPKPTEIPQPPSLDELFDRIKDKPTSEDRKALIKTLRAERRAWQKKQEDKRK